MIRVLVAASSPVARAGLEAIASSNPALAVGAVSSTGGDLQRRIEEVQPDVVLLDPDVRDEDLSVLIQGIAIHDAAIVLLADDAGLRYLRAGARAILPQNASPTEIVAAIEAVAAGLIVFHPDLLDVLSERASSSAAGPLLTGRENEVLRMMSEGLANKEIAYRLGISEHTVKFHVTSLFNKLNASSRTEAVTIGVRKGIVML